MKIPDLDVGEEMLDGLLVMEPREDFDRCILGIVERYNQRFVLYSKACVLEVVDADSSEEEDPQMAALEHYEYNIVGGWVGETTPGFLDDVEDGDLGQPDVH